MIKEEINEHQSQTYIQKNVFPRKLNNDKHKKSQSFYEIANILRIFTPRDV